MSRGEPRTLLARADGSMLLGMGNVTRCMAIAKEFESSGFSRVVWVGREHDARVRDYVTAGGCEYVGMPEQLSMEDDAALFLELAQQQGARFAVVDLANPVATHDLGRYSRYLQQLATACTLAIVDDMTRAVFPAAVVINPNTGVHEAEYDCRLAPTFLFGPQHAVLRSSYRGASAGKVYGQGEPRQVVITLGGGDTARGILPDVLRGVRSGLGPMVQVRLCTGLDDGEALRRSGALQGFQEPVTILQNVPSLTEELSRADIAIVSGGVTKYESAATGTPSIMIATIDHQEWWGNEFAQTGAALYAGGPSSVSSASVAAACQELRDPETRKRMGLRGAHLVDARGTERIVAGCFKLRAAAVAPAPQLE